MSHTKRSVTDRCFVSYNEQKNSVKSLQIPFQNWGLKNLGHNNLKFKSTLWILILFLFPSTIIFLPTSWCMFLGSSDGRKSAPQVSPPTLLWVPPALQQTGKAARNQQLDKYLGVSSTIMWVFLILMLSLLCLQTGFQIFPGALTFPLSHAEE